MKKFPEGKALENWRSSDGRAIPTSSSSSTENLNNGIPLYIRLASILRSKIRSGDLPLGSKMPTNGALVEQYGMGRSTVRHAIDQLSREGLVSSSRGSGTFVAREIPSLGEFEKIELPYIVGRNLNINIIEIVRNIDPPQEYRLGACTDRFSRVRKLHEINGLSYSYIDMYIREDYFSKLPPDQYDSAMFSTQLQKHAGICVALLRQELTIIIADAEVANLLQIGIAEPVVKLMFHTEDESGTPLLLATHLCRSDRFKLTEAIEEPLTQPHRIWRPID